MDRHNERNMYAKGQKFKRDEVLGARAEKVEDLDRRNRKENLIQGSKGNIMRWRRRKNPRSM